LRERGGTDKIYGLLFLIGCLYLAGLSFFPDIIDQYTSEDGIIETASVIFCFLGAYLCARLFLLKNKMTSRRCYLLLLGALIFIFVGGEEMSWGQRLLVLKPVTATFDLNYQREWTLHNLKGVETEKADIMIAVAMVIFFGILPIVALVSKGFKRFWEWLGIPFVSVPVFIGMWFGFICMIIGPEVLRPSHSFFYFFSESDFRIQEYREFYFPFLLFSWVFRDYFYILKRERGTPA
jgi:hypothetical protein